MKRLRPIRSCLVCRQKRLRCDQLQPSCTRCSSANIQCSYDPGTINAPAGNTSPVAQSSQYSMPLQNQGISSTHVPSGTIQQVQDDFDRERGEVFVENGGRSYYVGPTFWGNAIPAEGQKDHNIVGFPLRLATNPFPRYYIPYDDVLRWQSQQQEPSRPNGPRMPKVDPVQCKLCGQKYKLGCIISLLPLRQICERLCDLFFSVVFPMIPILHPGSFADDFRTFWEERSASMGHNDGATPLVRRKPGFVCVLAAILHAALKCSPKPQLQRVRDFALDLTAGDLYVLAVVSMNLSGFPRRPSHYSLAAYVLSQNPFVMEEDFPDFPDFINTAFRVSLGMGLHRKVSSTGIGIHELEIRRRLWWYILHLDIMSSASSGLSPLFVDSRMANVEMISQFDQLHAEELTEGHTRTIDVRYLVATKRYTVSNEIRHILRLHFEDALQSVEQVNGTAEKLQVSMQQVGETIQLLIAHAKGSNPRHPTTGSLSDTARTEASSFDHVWALEKGDQKVQEFCAWSAILLHLMVHKAFCVLYHPLFRDPDMVSNPQMRTSAVIHAQAFLQLFIRLCNDPTSEPFHWIYPGIYQPLQATSLLIADLLQFPRSAEASVSRGLIDAVFEQYQIDEGLVSVASPPSRQLSGAGRDAWKLLAAARRKALNMVLEDHHVLLPSRCSDLDVCICGERFAESEQPEEYGRSEVSENPASSAGFLFPADLQNIASEPLVDTGFEWHQWDATMGDMMDFIS